MIIPYFLPNLGMGASDADAPAAPATGYSVMRHFYVLLALLLPALLERG